METKQTKVENKKVETKNLYEKMLLSALILFAVIFLFFFYYLFFYSRINVVEVSRNLRETVLDFALDEEHTLDNYESILFANRQLTYNSCTNEIEFPSDRFSWARDWLYLPLADSLYAEMKGGEYDEETDPVLVSLREQYVSSDGRSLDLHELWGLESYCLPYFILNKLSSDSKTSTQTLDLAQTLCYDFYDIEGLTGFSCEEPLCMSDQKFYSQLEELFSNENYFPEDTLLSDFTSYFPPQGLVDDYIVAYGNDLDSYVEMNNSILLRSIEYKKYYVDNRSYEGYTNPCIENDVYYFDLLRAMAVKKNYLSDDDLMSMHEKIESELFNLCSSTYPEVDDILIQERRSLGHIIESYYLFDDMVVDKNILDDLVKESLTEDLLQGNSGDESYTLLARPTLFAGLDGCSTIESMLNYNLKTSFYLLLYERYGN